MTGPAMDWNAWFGNSDQRKQEYEASWQRVSEYYNQWARQTTPSPQYVPSQQTAPAHQGWEDEDLVGAAMYWGIPEHSARQMPREALIHFVNQHRDDARDGGASGLAMALAPLAQFGVGAAEGVTGTLQKIPLLGDWLHQGGMVHSADMYFRKLEEGVRSSTPQGEQGWESIANVGGNLTALWYPGTAAWAVAGKVGKIIPLASKMSPIGRAAIQGGLASYLLEGGTHDASDLTGDHATPDPWSHRAQVVGAGALIGGGMAAAAPLLKKASQRVVAAFAGGDGDLLQPGDLQGIGSPTSPAVPGRELGLQSAHQPDLGDLALAGDQQAKMMIDYRNPPETFNSDLGGGLPTQGLAAEPPSAGPEIGFREEDPIFGPRRGKSRRKDPDALVVQMNKIGTIIQSPALADISGHGVIDEVSVAHAAQESNPGGINITQGVVEPHKMVENFGNTGTLVVHDGRLDVITSDAPLSPQVPAEYQQHGVFTGQKVSTAEGITGEITSITPHGEATIEPTYAGAPVTRPVDQLHPSLESPQTLEAPPLWESFKGFLNQRAVETQQALGGSLDEGMLGIVKSKNMAQWMEGFLDEVGISSPGDRDRLRNYFNKRWVDSFKDLAPVEAGAQQAATAEYNQAVAANPLEPISQLDAHAQAKGFLAIPQPGGRWALRSLDVETTGQSGTQLSFDDREAAETWVRKFNRDLPDVTPSDGEVPTELAAMHPTQAMTPPNLNEQAGPQLERAVNEAEELTGGPPAGEPPAAVNTAAGNYGRNQSRLQQALSRWRPLRHVFAKADEVQLSITGRDYGIARDYDGLSHMLNLYHTDMRPYHDELANLLAPVKTKRLVSGEWAQVYETLDPSDRAAMVQRLGWSPKEVESLDRYDQLMQRLFPEANLDEVRQIPRYFSHIAARQSNPELFPRAFEDFHLGKTTTPFYEYVRSGNLNFRELDPRTVGDVYIRSVMWEKHMADTYNLLRGKWDRIAADDPVLKDTVSNLMGSYLDIVKGGYHAKDDLALDTMHLALQKIVDPAITRQEARELILGGLNTTYAGLIGYRPNMIARHFLQMTYAIPRVGTDLPRVLLQFMRSPEARKAILEEAINDGAISPRVFTRNAPGAFVGELERVGTGSDAMGPGGPVEPVEHSTRYKAIAAITDAARDAMPEGLKGQEDSVLRPLGAFSKAVERFQSVVYIAGKQRAARAISEFRAAGPAGDLNQLMGDSMARTFDPAWQREFKGMIASGPGMDEEAAKFMGRQLRDATFFKYGVAESPWVTKSVTGKVALQLGHYSLNYLQFLRESLVNGTAGDKAKFLLTIGATTAGLEAASRETGWNLRWLNPYLAFVPGAGPMVGMAVALGTGGKHLVDAARDNDASAGGKAVHDFANLGREATNMLPFSGLVRDAQGIQAASQSPQPALTAADYLLTGHVGSEPEDNRSLMPYAQAAFQQSLQPLQSPVRSSSVGVPLGQVPRQPITDPVILQSTPTIPGANPQSGSTSYTSGVAPGAVSNSLPYGPPSADQLRQYGVSDPSRVYEKGGQLVYDSKNVGSDGHTPTHRLADAAKLLKPGETWEEYEAAVIRHAPNGAPVVRDLGQLDNDTQKRVSVLMHAAQQAGVQLEVGETLRTQQRQEDLFRIGREGAGNPVTWTLTSAHATGRAIDFIVNGDSSGKDPGYRWLWDTASQLGLVPLREMDPGHLSVTDSSRQAVPLSRVESVPRIYPKFVRR